MLNKMVAVLVVLFVLSGCTTAQVRTSYYDSDGNVTKVVDSKITTPVEYGKVIGDVLGAVGKSFLTGYADMYIDKMLND